tara:strand:- start:277 stop:846 length:570 start_codon:yes stop_codon:yes gene_type:complete
MYCVFLGKAVQTVNPPNASVGASQIIDASITSAKLASGVLPTNTPAFSAYSTTPQSVSSGTFTKVVFDVEDYDTDNAYDNATNYRFTVPSGAAGKYLVKARLNFRSTSDNITYGLVAIYKNGVKFQQVLSNSNGISNAAFRDFTVSNEHGMILEVSDYIEIFGYAVGTSPIFSHDALRYSLFQMEKIIE